MDSKAKLIQAGPTTRTWLQRLRDDLPLFEYNEARYYASFRATSPRRVIAYLNPLRGSIRLFLPLRPEDDSRLRPTPSTSNWAVRFPSILTISRAKDLANAVRLIDTASAATEMSSLRTSLNRPKHVPAEELLPEPEYYEGAARTIQVNAYERNERARRKCIEDYGTNCFVCEFNFEAVYGEWAAGYIHVHHIVPIAKLRKSYRLDPIADLRPVCANCHAVIHRRDPPFSIDEVKQMILTAP